MFDSLIHCENARVLSGVARDSHPEGHGGRREWQHRVGRDLEEAF